MNEMMNEAHTDWLNERSTARVREPGDTRYITATGPLPKYNPADIPLEPPF